MQTLAEAVAQRIEALKAHPLQQRAPSTWKEVRQLRKIQEQIARLEVLTKPKPTEGE